MARRRKVYVHDFATRNQRSIHFPILVDIRALSGHSRSMAYEACAQIRRRKTSAAGTVCARGPAPRRALGAALKKLGATLVRRSSAFRGT